jgi:lipopolysaccharide transport system ATP-binding protein
MIESKVTEKVLPHTVSGQSEKVVLSVRNISKKFCKNLKLSMFYGIVDLSKNLLGLKPNADSLRKSEFWAIDNVSFQLRRGQVIGLVGVNGSGKSTLLKLVAGIFPPDKGEITVKGRIGSLISLGAGFHPHMTGHENIYLNGAILGMSHEEIDSKVQSIIDFAELGDFIDAPVATYSSGMRVRLGFSIAIAIKPDILLLDEVLAVGDRRFRSKCYYEIDKISEDSAIIFVSHNMANITRICTDIIVMDQGEIKYQSNNIAEGIDHYFSLSPAGEGSITGAGKARLHSLTLSSDSGGSSDSENDIFKIKYLDTLTIDINFSIDSSIQKAVMNILFIDKEFNHVSSSKSDLCNFVILNNSPEFNLRVKFPNIQLSPGMYSVAIKIMDKNTDELLLNYHNIKDFQVTGGFNVPAPVHFQADWSYV